MFCFLFLTHKLWIICMISLGWLTNRVMLQLKCWILWLFCLSTLMDRVDWFNRSFLLIWFVLDSNQFPRLIPFLCHFQFILCFIIWSIYQLFFRNGWYHFYLAVFKLIMLNFDVISCRFQTLNDLGLVSVDVSTFNIYFTTLVLLDNCLWIELEATHPSIYLVDSLLLALI